MTESGVNGTSMRSTYLGCLTQLEQSLVQELHVVRPLTITQPVDYGVQDILLWCIATEFLNF